MVKLLWHILATFAARKAGTQKAPEFDNKPHELLPAECLCPHCGVRCTFHDPFWIHHGGCGDLEFAGREMDDIEDHCESMHAQFVYEEGGEWESVH